MAGIYNRLVFSQGQARSLGASGGVLLLNPPAQIAGQITFQDMQNRVWHLLREPGPDTGFLPPQNGDFAQPTVKRDLNIALGMFIGETGLAPKVSDRQVTLPVFAGRDYPIPPDTQGIYAIEYTPQNQQTFTLEGSSFEEFKAFWADDTYVIGQPRYYRQMFAGYVRLYPQPGPGQAMGPGTGTVTFFGTATAGNTVAVTITNAPGAPVVVPTYVVLASDTPASIAQAVSTLVNNSNACVGPGAFLQPSSVSDDSFQMTSLQLPGTNITFSVVVTSTTLTATPSGVATFQPNGDTITFYFSSTGKFLYFPNDTTQLPPQLQMAPVYSVLSDYWCRKADPEGNAAKYLARYERLVQVAKALEWDAERSVQPTTGDYYDASLESFYQW